MCKEMLVILGPIFHAFFSGKIPPKISWKIFPQKCWEKIDFSAKKVLKNRFSKKFRGIFRGKKCTKNWPLVNRVVDRKRLIRKKLSGQDVRLQRGFG
jgi:hypothetical protein